MNEVTTAAAWLAGLAIVALMATGWRKPARAASVSARGARSNRPAVPHQVREEPAPLYRGTPWYRRVWAVMWGGALAVWIGAVIATVCGLGASWLVIRLTDMLRK